MICIWQATSNNIILSFDVSRSIITKAYLQFEAANCESLPNFPSLLKLWLMTGYKISSSATE